MHFVGFIQPSSAQSHVLAQSPPGRRPNDKYPVNTSHRSVLCKNVSQRCYRVATVIHIQSVHSPICVYIHMFCTIWRRCSGKRNKKTGTTVTAACQGNLSACRTFGISGLTHTCTMQHSMKQTFVDSSRYVMAHGDAREGK